MKADEEDIAADVVGSTRVGYVAGSLGAPYYFTSVARYLYSAKSRFSRSSH